MATPLRVLILEDVPDDAELVVHALQDAGFEPTWHRVDTEAAYRDALDPAWQIILADYTLPQFDAPRALALLKERGLDVPFIVVTVPVSEEAAVACMKQGAADYLLKDRLARLGMAVQHALEEKRVRDERQQAEDELKRSKVFLNQLLNAIADPIFVKDEEHRWVVLNEAACEAVGHSREDLIGKSDYDLYPKEQADIFWERDDCVLRTGATDLNEEEITWQGEIRTIATRKSLFTDTTTGERFIAGVIRDITERKRREEQLVAAKEKAEEMTRLKDALLTNMSHEIRTPLTAVIGFADLLVDEVSDVQRETVTLIREGGRRLLRTLNAVLDLARLEADGFELTAEPVDVQPVLHQAAGLFKALAQQKALDFKIDLPRSPVFVRADRTGLDSILNHLLSNALKFTEAGWVAVRVYADDASGYIVVEDTGIGMDEAFVPHLFDAFQQESTGLTRDHEGTGLGMTITKRLVEAMGGQIMVQSKKEHGTRFILCFPRVPPLLQADDPADSQGLPRATPPTASPPTPCLPLRILMAEDNLVNQKVTLRLLQRLGYTADVAANGHEALQALERAVYDVVLMDIQMPVMNGLEATRQICARYDVAGRPRIIAVTANAMTGDRERCLEAGMDDYLSKPVRLEVLDEALRRCSPLGTAPSANEAQRNPSFGREKRLGLPVHARSPKGPRQGSPHRRRQASP